MIEVRFYDEIDDSLLDYAVVAARYRGKWVFCKHRERDTYECPGGRRESGEAILETAKRELWEETGATKYELKQLCAYSVVKDGAETFGMLFYGEIHQFGNLPPLEIEKVELTGCPTGGHIRRFSRSSSKKSRRRILSLQPAKRDIDDKDHGDEAGEAADDV